MKKVYIWGTGRIAGNIIGSDIKLESITAFIDNDINKQLFMGKKVFRPEEMLSIQYDAILIAVLDDEQIMKQCISLHFEMDKVIELYGNIKTIDTNHDYDFIKKIVGVKLANKIKKRFCLIRTMMTDTDFNVDRISKEANIVLMSDYVRVKTFELVVSEISSGNVPGNVAELGVFKGDFAQFINVAFKDRILYLFDTFNGFNDHDVKNEIQQGNCSEAFVETYKSTCLETVMRKMQHPDKVIVKAGLFPESLNGLEDSFAFVSLDCDFEKPILDGLAYFYPRLSTGGYIFIHDYNSRLGGVRNAVRKFEVESGQRLCKVL